MTDRAPKATDRARTLRAYLQKEIHIGRDVDSGRELFLPLRELAETSGHVVGAAGSGKKISGFPESAPAKTQRVRMNLRSPEALPGSRPADR